MNDFVRLTLALMGIMSAVTFCLFGADKHRAVKGAWRIRERTLLLSALCLGAPGGLLGMYLFRHKTRHAKFRILIPLFCVINIALVCAAARC